MISARRTVDATVEPVTLAQAQAQCRIVGDQDDALLTTYIAAARRYAEKQLGRAILAQTWLLSRDIFPGYLHGRLSGLPCTVNTLWLTGKFPQLSMQLPWPNLISVESVTYLDGTGARQTLDPSLYAVDSNAEPARIVPAPGTYWPATLWGRSDAVQVTYTAGYGTDPSDVPASVQLAILGLVAHWYENRESVVLTSSPNAVTIVPQFVDELLESEAAPAVFDLEA